MAARQGDRSFVLSKSRRKDHTLHSRPVEGPDQQVDEFRGTVSHCHHLYVHSQAGGQTFPQEEAVAVRIRGDIGRSGCSPHPGRGAQRVDAGTEVHYLLCPQTQGTEFARFQPAVYGGHFRGEDSVNR